MKMLVLFLVAGLSLPNFAQQSYDAEDIEYNNIRSLYSDVLDQVFYCEGMLKAVNYRYTEDYRTSELEQYFSFSDQSYCFIEAIEVSIHDQVFDMYYLGFRDVESIVAELKLKQTVISLEECTPLVEKYWDFFNIFASSVTAVATKNRKLNERKLVNNGLIEVLVLLHPSIFEFSFDDYALSEFNTTEFGVNGPLHTWSTQVIAIGAGCNQNKL